MFLMMENNDYPQRAVRVFLFERGNREWLKSKFILSARNVAMIHNNGWGSAPVVGHGTVW